MGVPCGWSAGRGGETREAGRGDRGYGPVGESMVGWQEGLRDGVPVATSRDAEDKGRLWAPSLACAAHTCPPQGPSLRPTASQLGDLGPAP